jgi:predicted amidohydrolase
MRDLTVHLVQADLVWQNEAANLEKLGKLIEPIADDGIIMLPEMFATGFTMQPQKYATEPEGTAVQWMRNNSIGRAVCGSLSTVENGKYYNRFYWAENGEIKYTYNKKHLFSIAEENLHYTVGTEQVSIEYKGWKINPFICFDLRFPVWCRNVNEAHLMLFVANWPEVRIAAWEKLLQARAIENQCYVAGVNRVGVDGNGIVHNGNSLICNGRGEIMQKLTNKEGVISQTISALELMTFRDNFPVLKDMDKFALKDA